MGAAATPEGTQDPVADAGDAGGDAGAEGKAEPSAGSEDRATDQTLAEYKSGLHPILRDMHPQQITDLLETMSAGMRTPTKEEPKPTPEPVKPLEVDMMDPNSENYNPGKYITETVQRSFGGVVNDLQANAMTGVFGDLRSKIPDFAKYEDRIKQKVAELPAGATVTGEQLARAYFELKGLDSYNADKAATAKAASVKTERPSTPVKEGKEIELSEQERIVAPKMFPRAKTSAEAEKMYKDYATAQIMEEGVIMDVPIGGGKNA